MGIRKLTKEEVERVTKEAPRDPEAEPDEQLNEFCRKPPCASPMCRRDRRCNFA
jgi:hypothetical protein